MSKVVLLAGLGFGDEGKGSITDYLSKVEDDVRTVVRYNGGHQAGHNVVTSTGRHHTFSQFGSGGLSGIRTHLSRFMIVSPLALANEADALGDWADETLTIDREALVTNPYQAITNRIREVIRGKARHGSCGVGIGETVCDAFEDRDMVLRFGDLSDLRVLLKKLHFARDKKLTQLMSLPEISVASPDFSLDDVYEDWACIQDLDFVRVIADRFHAVANRFQSVDRKYFKSILEKGTVLFEGAQGVLLDQDFGFYPHTTWSDTTFRNADMLLQEAEYTGPQTRIGVLRGYMTRHGAGPLPTEVDLPVISDDAHNRYHKFQHDLRLGYFDLVLANYALRVIGPLDQLVLTNLDKLPRRPQVCSSYDVPSESSAGFPVSSTIYEIPVRRPVDLQFQSDITKILSRAKPVYEHMRSRAELVKRIRDALGVPIPLCSHGPTSLDKTPTSLLLETPQWNF